MRRAAARPRRLGRGAAHRCSSSNGCCRRGSRPPGAARRRASAPCGLAVLNDDGTPVRWPAALTRNLLRAVDFLPFLYGVGLVVDARQPRLQAPGRPRRRHRGGVPGREGARRTRTSRRRTPIAPPVALALDEQRAVLELAERSATLTQERVEELAELPAPLVGQPATASAAARRLIGIANHIAGRA